jgi:RHS Repeat
VGWDYSTLTTMAYDAAGHLVSQTTGQSPGWLSQGTLYSLWIDSEGNWKWLAPTETAPEGWTPYAKPMTTNYGYDALGRQTKVVVAAQSPLFNQKTTMAYDAAGDLTSMTTPGTELTPRVRTDYAYDALGRQTKATAGANVAGLSRTTTTQYDAANNVVQVTDPLGVITDEVRFPSLSITWTWWKVNRT